MPKKKVLHLVEDLNIGGLEKVVASIATGLNKNKYDIQVWCLTKGGKIADELISKNISIKILGLNNYHNPLQIIILAKYLKKSKIDIIHSHGYFANTFGRLASILARVPVKIVHVHTTDYIFKSKNILVERLLSLFTKKIICVSNSVKDFVEKTLGITKGKVCLVYNGCGMSNESKSEYQFDRFSFGLGQDDFVIIVVASLAPHKGHRVLIDATKDLVQKFKKLRLLIVGDGPLRNELESYVSDLKLSEHIFFIGQKQNVFPYLKIADVFVLPSIKREGFGIALIEAMAMGIPVIGSKLGGIPEIIDNQGNGILFPPGDFVALAGSIKKMIVNKKLRDRFGAVGRVIYKNKFTNSKMINSIEILYDDVSN